LRKINLQVVWADGGQSHFLRNQLNTIGLAMVIALSRLSNSSIMLLKSGGEMLQDNKRHACVGRQIAKKLFERFQPASGRADPHDQSSLN